VKRWQSNFENWKIGNIFACGATTSSATTKWGVLLDSARQIGLGNTSHEFSDCSGGLSKRGEVCWAGILFAGGIWNVFASSSTHSYAMVKQR